MAEIIFFPGVRFVRLDGKTKVDQITLNNEMVLDRIRGVPASPSTPETDADPRNPIQR